MVWRKKRTPEVREVSHEAKPAGGASPSSSRSSRNSDVIPAIFTEKGGADLSRFMGAAARGVRPFVVPSSYTVSGNLSTIRPVAVRGVFEKGELVAPLAVILPGGQLRATSRVDVLKVYGGVSATVQARRLVEVLEKGRIEGSIETPEISVASGAIMSGVSLAVGPKRKT